MSLLRGMFTGLLTWLFRKFPIIPAVVFSLLAVAAAIGGVVSYRQAQSLSEEPAALSFNDAVEKAGAGSLWVTLYGMQKKCSQARTVDSEYIVPLGDPDSTSLVLFSPIKSMDICNLSVPEPVTGLFEQIGSGRLRELEKEGFEILDSYSKDQIWTLCGSCKRSGAMQGVYLCFGVFTFSLLIALIFYRMQVAKKNTV
jgi:hypothetical protein